MALSSAGWEAAALTVKYSCASLALIRALARPRPSSKAALAALKFRTARRSNEANCEPAKPSRVSTPALFALAICSGVKYMVFFLQEEFGGCRVGWGRGTGLWRCWLCVMLHRNNCDSTRETADVKKYCCSATTTLC